MPPSRKFTDDEKRQLVANLDIEGIYSNIVSRLELMTYWQQSHIAVGSSRHGCRIVSKTLPSTRKARYLAYQSKSGA